MKITQWIYNKAQIIRRSERNFVRGLKDPNDGLFPLRVARMISLRFDFSHSPHFISFFFFFQRSPPRYLPKYSPHFSQFDYIRKRLFRACNFLFLSRAGTSRVLFVYSVVSIFYAIFAIELRCRRKNKSARDRAYATLQIPDETKTEKYIHGENI